MGLAQSLLTLAAGIISVATSLQSVLASKDASAWLSQPAWERLIKQLGGSVAQQTVASVSLDLPFAGIAMRVAIFAVVSWLAGALVIGASAKRPLFVSATDWAVRGWKWWLLPAGWELLRLLLFMSHAQTASAVLHVTSRWCYAIFLAGWLTTLWELARPEPRDRAHGAIPARVPNAVTLLAIGLYVAVFTSMNWQLYWNLQLPHGDSAMYEEHLWNLTHGKGFRSYLDQGLFLGEHIQVIHVLLTPLHLIWPSHLLLELAESFALAMGAWPVYMLTLRHSQSRKTATALALAWLLYFPTHHLDISIDFKTFRPMSLGVPALMFALESLDRCRWKSGSLWLILALSAKEDFAVVIATLGIWIAVTSLIGPRDTADSNPANGKSEATTGRGQFVFGLSVAAASTMYVLLAVTVLIPFFRDGAAVHYTRYFGDLGQSPADIVKTAVEDPLRVLKRLFSARSGVYAVLLMLPLAGLPFRSLSRLAVAGPWFGILCLLELTADASAGQELLVPFHHFHASIVPIIFWAAAARPLLSAQTHATVTTRQTWWPRMAACAALTSGLFYSIGPLGSSFWDSGAPFFWKTAYVVDDRARLFDRVIEHIPETARVASTDFVHPRFTHHERSYDYSNYLRKVANYEARVPSDTDFIVIDTRHRYSEMRDPRDVPEASDAEWELMPDFTNGNYIVLRKRNASAEL